MERKYEILTNLPGKHNTYRIRALRDFGDVKAGDIGGFVESKWNLSDHGNCWIYDNAVVREDARVVHNGRVRDWAVVKDKAAIIDNAECLHSATIGGQSRIYDNAVITDHAMIGGVAEIWNDVVIAGWSNVGHNAKIYGQTLIDGDAEIAENAYIKQKSDYFTLKGFGHVGRTTTFYKGCDGNIYVSCGCFNNTLKKFKQQVNMYHFGKYTKCGAEYLLLAEAAEIHFGLKKPKKKLFGKLRPVYDRGISYER